MCCVKYWRSNVNVDQLTDVFGLLDRLQGSCVEVLGRFGRGLLTLLLIDEACESKKCSALIRIAVTGLRKSGRAHGLRSRPFLGSRLMCVRLTDKIHGRVNHGP